MLRGLNQFGFGQVPFREGHCPGEMLTFKIVFRFPLGISREFYCMHLLMLPVVVSNRVEYSFLFPQRVAKFHGVRQRQEAHRAEEALGVW